MVELKRVIDEDQRTYVQWAEEKLSLANIAADLLVQHRTAVDKDVGALLAELKVCQRRRCHTGGLLNTYSHCHITPQLDRTTSVWRIV